MLPPLAISVSTDPAIREDTSSTTALCPDEGRFKVIADDDGSFASLEYPENTPNVYRVGTNLSHTQFDCT